ncbi:hypothetical protein EC2730450_4929 [Escherichia coli 2730450]|nr:hypothetical protein EC2730450_4929 [Escherichia coli 2730450]ENA74280.1 hypothetical protein EC2741950_4791 [Escherichia coli 2741950]ENB23173.1 hypothetical protein ECBCE030MS09_4945 [Escherichia coli BCE030_MS-09]
MADAAAPFVLSGTEAKQPKLRMLAVNHHRLAFANNLHCTVLLKSHPRSENGMTFIPPTT